MKKIYSNQNKYMNNPSDKMYFRRDLNYCFFLLQISTLIIKTIIIIIKNLRHGHDK